MGVTLARGHKVIRAAPDDDKDFVLDPKGYFLIRLKRDTKEIEVGLCRSRNIVETIIVGKTPKEIYETIIRLKLVSRLEHAAYIGRELEKAHVALRLGLEYVQDDELAFT